MGLITRSQDSNEKNDKTTPPTEESVNTKDSNEEELEDNKDSNEEELENSKELTNEKNAKSNENKKQK